MQENLSADKDQHQRQRVFQVDKAVHQRSQGEVQRAQAEDREDVRGIDDKRVLSDGEYRGHTVYRKYQVSQLDQHQCQQQRGGVTPQPVAGRVVQADEKAPLMQLIGDPDMPAKEFQHGVLCQVRVLDFTAEQHLDPGQQQKGAEYVENPVELLHQRRAQADHDRAQHDDPEDAPEQYPVLVAPRNAEEAENHRHDEHVVHRQRLLDQKAGVELQCLARPELPPDPGAEQQAHTEVAAEQQQALAHFNLMLVAVEYTEVEYQKCQDNGDKGQPEPGRRAKKGAGKQSLQSVHEPSLQSA